MIEELRNKGLTKDEFAFAKESLINSDGFRYNTPEKRLELILTEKIFQLPTGYLKNYGEKISEVSYEEANAAIKKFLDPSRLMITVLGDKKIIPEIAEAVKVPVSEIQTFSYEDDI